MNLFIRFINALIGSPAYVDGVYQRELSPAKRLWLFVWYRLVLAYTNVLVMVIMIAAMAYAFVSGFQVAAIALSALWVFFTFYMVWKLWKYASNDSSVKTKEGRVWFETQLQLSIAFVIIQMISGGVQLYLNVNHIDVQQQIVKLLSSSQAQSTPIEKLDSEWLMKPQQHDSVK